MSQIFKAHVLLILLATILRAESSSSPLPTLILEFPSTATSPNTIHIGKKVTDLLANELGGMAEYKVFDRTTLDKVLKEPGVTKSSLTNVSAVSALGTKYKAKAIVTGEIISYGSWISIHAKLIDADNTKLIQEATIEVKSKSELKAAVKSLALKLTAK